MSDFPQPPSDSSHSTFVDSDSTPGGYGEPNRWPGEEIPPPNPSQPISISGPLSLGEIIDRAFRLYRNHFGLLLLTAAIFLVPLGLFGGWFTGSFMVTYLDLIENLPNTVDPGGSEPDLEEVISLFFPLAGFAGTYILLLIAGILVQSMVSLSLIAHTLAFLRGEVLTVGDSFRSATSRLLPFIGKSIVQWLIILAGTAGVLMLFGCAVFVIVLSIGGGLSFLSNGFGPSDTSSINAFGTVIGITVAILAVCAYLLFILMLFMPSIFFSARYIAASVGLVDQNWGAVESLRESWALTKGRTWRSIGYIFLLGLLTLIVINVPIGIIQQIVTIFVDMEMLGFYAGVFAGASALMNVLWQPFYMAALVLFYMDLRVRQENYDIDLRLQHLEGQNR